MEDIKKLCHKVAKNILLEVIRETTILNTRNLNRIDDILVSYKSDDIESLDTFSMLFLSDLKNFNDNLVHSYYEKNITTIFNILQLLRACKTRKGLINGLLEYNIRIEIKSGIIQVTQEPYNGIIERAFELAIYERNHTIIKNLLKIKEEIILSRKLESNKFSPLFKHRDTHRDNTVRDFYNSCENIEKEELQILLTTMFCEIMNLKYGINEYTNSHKNKYDICFNKGVLNEF